MSRGELIIGKMAFYLDYQPSKCPICDAEPLERSEEPYMEWVLFRCGAKWGIDHDPWSGSDIWDPFGQPWMCNNAQAIAYQLIRGKVFNMQEPRFKQV